jgi:hypothetical protein
MPNPADGVKYVIPFSLEGGVSQARATGTILRGLSRVAAFAIVDRCGIVSTVADHTGLLFPVSDGQYS